ncbi:MAG: branched-chain amino acid ABC transporter permease [Candidatus Bathyarchaeia archaeon]
MSSIPIFLSEFTLHLLFILFIYITLAQAFNMLAGFCGYLSLGHVAYYGIGMYITAVLVRFGQPLSIACFCSAASAGVFGLVVSLPLFRLRGASFALGTLAISTFMHTLFSQEWLGLGGSAGLVLRIPYSYGKIPFYFASFIAAVLVTLITKLIRHSRFGLALLSIREDEDVAEVLGVKTLKEKLKIIWLSAFFTGLCGGIMALYMGHICPDNAFPLTISLQMQFMSILGGLGTVIGPIVGAVTLVGLDSLITFTIRELNTFFYALIILLTMIFMPDGIWGTFVEYRRKRVLKSNNHRKEGGSQ